MLEEFMKPLDGKYCDYFYLSGLFSLFLFFYAVGVLIYKVLTMKDKLYILIEGSRSILSSFIMYFVSRLMYSMCVKSLI